VFCEEATVLFPYYLALLYKDNFEKNHNKKKQKKNPSGEILQQSIMF